jgi:hypothetical protein
MRASTHEQTQFVHRGTSIVERATTGLPPDLLNRAATRLQTLAWLYAFTFFMAAFFPRLLFPEERRILFESAMSWAPGVISITVAVSVALAIRTARLRPAAVTVLALVFEVISSYGIAAAEFLDPNGLDVGEGWIGLSWRMSALESSTPWAPRSRVLASWEATGSRSDWVKGAWARSGGQATACSRGRQRSN